MAVSSEVVVPSGAVAGTSMAAPSAGASAGVEGSSGATSDVVGSSFAAASSASETGSGAAGGLPSVMGRRSVMRIRRWG